MTKLSLFMGFILCLIVANMYGNDQQNNKRLNKLILTDVRKKPDPKNSFAFDGKARFAGYIKGYDPRQNGSDITGIVYTSNEFTREDAPYAIEPDSTGWFQVEFDLSAPARVNMALGNAFLNPYFEPGLTTALVIDWDDWLSNRDKNQELELKKSFFTGATGRLNNELYELSNIEMKGFYDKKFDNVDEITSCLTSAKDSVLQLLEKALKQKDYLPLTHQLAKNDILTNYGEQMLDKISDMKLKNAQIIDGAYIIERNDTIYHGRYDFIKEIPDKPFITASLRFSSFINRYEYCDIFRSRMDNMIDDNFFKWGFAELNPDLQRYRELLEEKGKYKLNSSEENKDKLIFLMTSLDSIQRKYPDITAKVRVYSEIKKWISKADDLKQYGLQPGFFYQTALVRSLNGFFRDNTSIGPTVARLYIDYIKSNILTYPLLREEAESVFVNRFENQAYTLPEGKATDFFRKIIEPYKGKIVIIDFWAIWCAPCMQGIKDLTSEREKYKDSPNIAMLYLCGATPKDRYEQAVQEFGLYNSMLLNDSEWNQMRQLFKFNGIPRYVLIGKDGKLITNKFQFARNFNMDTRTFSMDVEKSIKNYFINLEI